MESIDISYIREPVDRNLLLQELKQRHFLRKTNYGDKEIYVTTAHRSPNIMQEIGRLRELSFALQGGGTGKPVDIDEYDTLPDPHCYKQLFVWSPADQEIVGAYRFIHGTNILQRPDGTYATSAASEFHFSEEFIRDYLPYTVELGRAFVQPKFQPGTNLSKGLYSLDNLWDGIGGLAMEIPETYYFFGKVTMYSQMNPEAKDLILYFLKKHFPDRYGLLWPYEPRDITTDFNKLHRLFRGRNYKEDYQTLVHSVRELGSSVPPLINAYMKLSPTMRSFGTAMTHGFGDVDETGILIKLRDIYPDKRSRYFESYEKRNKRLDRRNLFNIDLEKLPWWGKSVEGEQESIADHLAKMRERQQQRRQERIEKRKSTQEKRKTVRKPKEKAEPKNKTPKATPHKTKDTKKTTEK